MTAATTGPIGIAFLSGPSAEFGDEPPLVADE